MNNARFSALLLMLVSLWCFASAEQAHALLDTHECSFCHDFHGGPGYSQLLSATNSEVLCLNCHSSNHYDANGDLSTKAAAVHNPGGYNSAQLGYITCRECHDAHSSQGGNVKMVGYRRDAQNWSSSFTIPGIRKELPSTSGVTYNVVTYTGPTDFYVAGSAVGACEACHAVNHKVGKDCTLCHGHATGFSSPGTPGTRCLGCHDGTDLDAPIVTYDSPHSKNTIFGTTSPDTFDCVDCHTNHGSGTVEVPNNPAVGIDYSLNGESGIALGSSSVPGNTEAEICWNCHALYGVSEWGVNTDTNGAGTNFNFGSLSQTNWVGATWYSASGQASGNSFWYKRGTIQSTHSTDSTKGLSGVDSVADIHCSNCHDVHNTYAGSPNGAPFLRGTWQGNPYLEDGAPQLNTTYTDGDASGDSFNQVPRGGTQWRQQGGYYIDQNTTNTPTSMGWTADTFGGLCELCHGNANGTWTGLEIAEINTFGTASTDWVGTNGHSAAVLGGDSSVAANIFDLRGGATSGNYDAMARQGRIDPGNGMSGDSYRNSTIAAKGGNLRSQPYLLTSGKNASGTPNGYNWGATVDASTIDTNYHNFSCSKCHNPHASRLPRLMITNCLDTNHNTWDDHADYDNAYTGVNTSGIPTNIVGKSLSNWSTAQNCHRKVGLRTGDPAPQQGTSGAGWNTVTPWTQ